MISQASRRFLAIFTAIVFVGSVVASLLVLQVGPSTEPNDDASIGLGLIVIGLVVAVVGMTIAVRVPDNRMGWIFLAGGTAVPVFALCQTYVVQGVVNDWDGVWVAAVLGRAIYMPMMLTLVALPLLLFPTGRLPSPRWRWLARAIQVFVALNFVGSALSPAIDEPLGTLSPEDIPERYLGTFDGEPAIVVDNPLGIDALASVGPALQMVFLVLLAVSFLGPPVSMLFRYRRSAGIERLQLKWLAFSASIAAVGLGAFYVVQEVDASSAFLDPLLTIGLLGVLGIPVTAGLAISRYRLYDIDRLISRTISYSLLVGALALVYAIGAVWLPTRIVGGQSPLFVAGSTLAIAALFNPVRRRLTGWADRRFNRTNYVADKVLEDLQRRLKDTVDLDQLTDDVVDIVSTTLQPSAIGAWVRDD